MSILFKLLARIFLFLLLTTPCYAVEITDLYRASVEVEDKSVKSRNDAVQQAFKTVLMKVGGQTFVLSNPTIKAALSSYRNYLTQYGYVVEEGRTLVEANFDQERVRELFQEANLPVWGRHRPLVLVWLMIEEGLDRSIVADSQESPLPNLIREIGDTLGLPFILPIMDITDSIEVSNSDVWGRFPTPILNASQRYNADANVVIRLSNSSLVPEQDTTTCQPLCQIDSYAIDWSILFNGMAQSPIVTGNDKFSLVKNTINTISKTLYERQAINLGQEETTTLIKFSNIVDIKSYVELTQLLNSLSIVKSTKLDLIEDNTYQFEVTLLGESRGLLDSLSLDNRFEKRQDSFTPFEESTSIPLFVWK